MIWNYKNLKLQCEARGDHFICLDGLWGQEETPVSIVNVYAPCKAGRKRSVG